MKKSRYSETQIVREFTDHWIKEYNKKRPHDALDDMTPSEYLAKKESLENSNLAWN
ncbi:integrase core domain-containing protein [Solemya velum gill symbiont]|uniref:integrase core domain-containing protein n=1 Tax=Solemya velum gill symbiont TaxID=2340 RepID=UPI0009978562|nr:integrase core domain-containing protein [Solemya velum gill symbiont]